MKTDEENSRKTPGKIVPKKLFVFSASLLLGFLAFLFISDYGYLLKKEERGHLASIFFNLNKFEIDIAEKDKGSCEISWNEKPIYKDGKLLEKNINSARYEYGINCFCVSMNDDSRYFYFFKPNNWEFHKFKFSIADGEIKFWIDEAIQDENK